MSSKKRILTRPPNVEEKHEFFRVYNTGLPGVDRISSKRFTEWWKNSHKNGQLEKLWRVVVEGDTIIAVVINLVNKELNWGFIWELAVDPDYRNHGIGTRLIRESEKLLKEYDPEIDQLAIGVKTNNLGAITLYERLNYRIRFLELHLKGRRWLSEPKSRLRVEPASPGRIQDLVKLVPDAYWGTRSEAIWKEFIRPDDRMLFTEKNELAGFIRITKEGEKSASSEVQFNIKTGYGCQVLDASMEFIETDYVDLWVQDNHQDILDTLYNKDFRRIDSEFLMRKPIRK